MSTKKQSHTGFRNGDLFCFHCGTSQKMPPMPIQLASDFFKSFDKLHRNCQKTWQEPVNEPNGKTETENANWWAVHGEHGVSSKTMFRYLCDNVIVPLQYESHPHDPDDFRRCYLLLKAVPQFRSKLGRMKNVSPTWSRLVDNWDKLTEMLEEQMQTKKPNGMYEFMQKLGC